MKDIYKQDSFKPIQKEWDKVNEALSKISLYEIAKRDVKQHYLLHGLS